MLSCNDQADGRHIEDNAELKWAFSLFRKRILPAKSKPVTSKSEQAGRRTGRLLRPTRTKPAILSALLPKDFRRRITRYVHDVWHAVHKEDVKMRLRIGLGDPADTGQL